MKSTTPWPQDATMTGMRFACSLKARHRMPPLDHLPEIQRWADDLGKFPPAVLSALYLEAIVERSAEAPILSQLVARAHAIRDSMGLSRRAAE